MAESRVHIVAGFSFRETRFPTHEGRFGKAFLPDTLTNMMSLAGTSTLIKTTLTLPFITTNFKTVHVHLLNILKSSSSRLCEYGFVQTPHKISKA